MGKIVIIVQSVRNDKNKKWAGIFQTLIIEEYPKMMENVLFVDSFDEAISLIPREGELVVASCDAFNDLLSDFRRLHETTCPDHLKNGAMLAEMIKKINPNTKFYIFPPFRPVESEFVDGFIPKEDHSGDMTFSDAAKVLDIVFNEK